MNQRHVILVKRSRFRAIPAILCLLLLCACTAQRGESPGGTDVSNAVSTGPAAVPHASTDADPEPGQPDSEVSAAIAAGEPALLWRIDDRDELGGALSSWSYEQMDFSVLWPEIQTSLLPEATELSCDYREEDGTTCIELQAGQDLIRIYLDAHGFTASGYAPEAAMEFASNLAPILSAYSGFTLREVPADTEELEILRYAFFVEDVMVDTEPYSTYTAPNDVIPGSVLSVDNRGSISLVNLIRLGKQLETYDLAAFFNMEEAKLLCELQWQANAVPLICTLDSYQPIYILDAQAGKLLPGWRFLGRFWGTGTGFTHGMDFLFDAVTGEVIRFG